ncbi:hypothetical protein [Vreelandella venusta]|uniref:Uncharacterized protein n=1 Tax=Vreelandella venusta TaxID=44935 RepID=A0AAP9ZB08_9GAMM|nr:hypothetical protein [Halomonas venusta]QRL02046.1 hypothetical protein JDS37_12035 [Halomonas venusta]GEK50643.1 hypothetical protein HVE01_13640 [Halomonas venusta]
MTVEKEIRDYLFANIRERDTKSRDIDLVLYFYGFGKDLWPTLEDAAIKFNVGDSEGRRSERPRQIIKSKFREVAVLSKFYLLSEFSKYLNSFSVHSSEDLNKYLEVNGLFDGDQNIVSLVRLLNDLGEAKEYKVYTIDLKELTRSRYNENREIIVGRESRVKALQKALKKAKTIPGLLGIARLQYLMEEVGLEDIEAQVLLHVIKSDSDSWFYRYNGEDYYLFESRDNVIVNSLEKIKNIASQEELNTLAIVLENSLKRRTAPKKRKYPPVDVIKQYLQSSKYTQIKGSIVQINIELGKLTDIEKAVGNYLSESNANDYPTISNYLISLGYDKPLVDKTVFHSPLLFVDKSEGKFHYKYRLIGRSVNNADMPNMYEVFRQKLIKASLDGTDGSGSVATRKEHHILSLWLFEGKEKEKCAICKKEFSVKSLVTAHKKKRKDCAENERTDPYIVMPLCVFGCDYLYENRVIYVDFGVVKLTDCLEEGYGCELSYIENIKGNRLDSKWLKGGDLYFPKPNKKKQSDA